MAVAFVTQMQSQATAAQTAICCDCESAVGALLACNLNKRKQNNVQTNTETVPTHLYSLQ